MILHNMLYKGKEVGDRLSDFLALGKLEGFQNKNVTPTLSTFCACPELVT